MYRMLTNHVGRATIGCSFLLFDAVKRSIPAAQSLTALQRKEFITEAAKCLRTQAKFGICAISAKCVSSKSVIEDDRPTYFMRSVLVVNKPGKSICDFLGVSYQRTFPSHVSSANPVSVGEDYERASQKRLSAADRSDRSVDYECSLVACGFLHL